MKILNVAHYYPPHVGGLENVAKRQAESQCKQGYHSVVVTCAASSEEIGSSLEHGVTVYRQRAWNFFETKFSIPFPIAGAGLVWRLWQEVKNCDVIQLHDVFYIPSWVTYVFARLHNKPLVLTQHVGFVEHPSPFVMATQRMVYNTIGRKIFNYADTIVVYNPHVRDFIKNCTKKEKKVLQIANGIDTALFKSVDAKGVSEIRTSFGLPLRPRLVLFVGRLVPKKGFDILYEARDDSFDLVYVGSGDVPEAWLKNPRFHFLGALTQAELAELYHAVDVLVSPTQGEIFTLVMQEAMASGLPVVTSDEAGYREYEINRELLILCERSSTALRVAILRILSSDELRKRMSEYSISLASELCDWNKNVQPLLAVYASLKNRLVLVTTSWDDGHVLDLKLATLLKKYGISGTFYISPKDLEILPNLRLADSYVRNLAEDFEIGAHTMTHRHLPTLTLADAWQEIIDSKQYLEAVVSKSVTSFCYPAGKYTKRHPPLVEAAGFTYARTVKRFSSSNEGAPFETETSVHTYDHYSDVWLLLLFVRFNPVLFFRYYLRWDLQAKAMFDRIRKTGGVFHLWGHSWEVDDNNDWERLENVLAHIGKHDDVLYITNSQQLTYGNS